MPLVPLIFPPGLFGQGTQYQSKGRWRSANLMRFLEGTVRPVGGWVELEGIQPPAQTADADDTPFDDTFTGIAGTLTGHSGTIESPPVTAPAWDDDGSADPEIELDGSGNISANVGTTRLHSVDLGRPITVTFKATHLSDTPADVAVGLSLFLRGKNLTTFPTNFEAITIGVYRHFADSPQFTISMNSSSDEGSSPTVVGASWVPGTPEAEHTYVVTFDGDTLSMTADGSAIFTNEPMSPAYDGVTHTEMGIQIAHYDETWGRVSLSEMGLTYMTNPGTIVGGP